MQPPAGFVWGNKERAYTGKHGFHSKQQRMSPKHHGNTPTPLPGMVAPLLAPVPVLTTAAKKLHQGAALVQKSKRQFVQIWVEEAVI